MENAALDEPPPSKPWATCALIAEACREAPRSAADLVPVLFTRQLDPHQMSFAFSETLAHVNYMLRRGDLTWAEAGDEVERVVASV